MKLLSVAAISPYGTQIDAHLAAKKTGVLPRTEFLEYVVQGQKRKIQVERALESNTLLPAPDSVIRRMSRSTRMALSVIEDAKRLSPLEWSSQRIGILVGTTHGPAQTNMDYVKRLVKFNYKGASPNLFAQSVHNNIASSIALTYGWKGPNLTLVHEENLWTALVNSAELWLQEKNADFIWMIVGNETSLHLPYIHLFDEVQKNPILESLSPTSEYISSESFSCFLLGRDDSSNKDTHLDLENSRTIASQYQLPEKLGIGVAEYFYRKYFL